MRGQVGHSQNRLTGVRDDITERPTAISPLKRASPIGKTPARVNLL
jgi:hypothetical protein